MFLNTWMKLKKVYRLISGPVVTATIQGGGPGAITSSFEQQSGKLEERIEHFDSQQEMSDSSQAKIDAVQAVVTLLTNSSSSFAPSPPSMAPCGLLERI